MHDAIIVSQASSINVSDLMIILWLDNFSFTAIAMQSEDSFIKNHNFRRSRPNVVFLTSDIINYFWCSILIMSSTAKQTLFANQLKIH